MKISVINPFLLRLNRGIERFAASLASALVDSGVHVNLITWQWPDRKERKERMALDSRVNLHAVPYSRYYISTLAVPLYIYWLMRESSDWVMIFFAGYGEGQALRFIRPLKLQKVCIVFHYPVEQVPHRYDEFERFGLIEEADRLIAVSAFVARGVKRRFGRECIVIENGVDTKRFMPSEENRTIIRRKLGISGDAVVIASLSALEERKGVQWMIRALPELLNEHPDLQYLVFGVGPFSKSLEQLIVDMCLEQNVHMMGDVDTVEEYLSACDIGCLLSYGEAFPIAILEMASMEMPVVTSMHPPFDEIIADDWGIRVDETDSTSVASAIHSLVVNPDLRKVMGQRARELVVQRYTWTHVASNYLAALSQK